MGQPVLSQVPDKVAFILESLQVDADMRANIQISTVGQRKNALWLVHPLIQGCIPPKSPLLRVI